MKLFKNKFDILYLIKRKSFYCTDVFGYDPLLDSHYYEFSNGEITIREHIMPGENLITCFINSILVKIESVKDYNLLIKFRNETI